MIDKIENFINRLNDMDWGWWPVLSLRPPKDKDLDNLIILKLTLIFGSVLGVLFLLVGWVTRVLTLTCAVVSFLIGWVLFFLVFKGISAYFWNRRARRLREPEDK